ncbi:MAG: hypothetical protein C4521_10495 [Actinobacteria bacterium]|nr:MAG: hypothetical protein C4521_10495 [Actinomycetota bacterium]
MAAKRLALLSGLIVLSFLLSSVAYARPASIPANDIERGVFVNPVPRAKGGGGGGEATESNTSYSYKGLHWPFNVVHYEVDTAQVPASLNSADVVSAVDASFYSWQAQYNILGRPDQSDIWYVNDGEAASTGPVLDGSNTVGFAGLSSGTLAATYYWYDRRSKNLIEFDIVFNTLYPWSTSGESGKYDVFNIGTHEAGHTLQLGDLYRGATSELTMYGYGAAGETKKQSLGLGDMLGLEKIYPTP